ncbi:hypothetical protein P7D15_01695 [Bacillus cereus]|uniref:hypothetical protein n=1 Tax=Bacillus cereus group TaxID=86661 RepID=UPI001F55DA0A|nr:MULTISPECIES: hypothetical protein [Bacillus cereus group]MDF9599129.1 hypothetical protein [Bacillus cereus]MDG1589462.1 hypothetical protein [Bacillus cereus]
MIRVGMIFLRLSIILKLIIGVSGIATGWFLFDGIYNNNWKIALSIALLAIVLKVTFETIARKLLDL